MKNKPEESTEEKGSTDNLPLFSFCNVEFEEGGPQYCYLADGDDYKAGDFVIVPAGPKDREAVVRITYIRRHPAADAPYPLDKIKRILRKCEPEEAGFPEKKRVTRLDQEEENGRDPAAYRKIGSIVLFGQYRKLREPYGGLRPIDWQVLDVQENKALLLSRFVLEAKAFHEVCGEDAVWENCTLRIWLNGEFLQKAFDPSELNAILTTEVDNCVKQGYVFHIQHDGAATRDRIFLLSYHEAWKYFQKESKRIGRATNYAQEQGVYCPYFDSRCWWYLRSPGERTDCAASVTPNGYRGSSWIHPFIYTENPVIFGIRPAFWLDLEAVREGKR